MTFSAAECQAANLRQRVDHRASMSHPFHMRPKIIGWRGTLSRTRSARCAVKWLSYIAGFLRCGMNATSLSRSGSDRPPARWIKSVEHGRRLIEVQLVFEFRGFGVKVGKGRSHLLELLSNQLVNFQIVCLQRC
jgi:hypothetical protein